MKKMHYNLATGIKIDGRSFAWRAALLVLATLLLAGLAVFNLARQFASDRIESKASGRIGQQMAERQRLSRLQRLEITSWKKQLQGRLAAANRLIVSKSFSFVARLDFLESIFPDEMRIRHLSLVNEHAGRITVAITARSLKKLYALYKSLAPYELVIANETQTADGYQVSLNFRISNEKI